MYIYRLPVRFSGITLEEAISKYQHPAAESNVEHSAANTCGPTRTRGHECCYMSLIT